MAVALHIGRLANRYHLPAGRAAEEERRRLDRLARSDLPQAVAERLPEVFAACGLPPEAEVVIRSLRLRLRGDIDLADLSGLLDAWSGAAAEALRALLAGRRGCVLDEEVAVFPDRLLLELAYLSEKAHGAAEPWWFEAAGPESGRPPTPEALIHAWISDRPERAAELLAGLARLHPAGVGALVTPAGWQALTDALIRSRRLKGGPAADRPPGREHESAPEPLTPGRRALFEAICRSSGEASVRQFWALVLYLDQEPGLACASVESLPTKALAAAPAVPAKASRKTPGEGHEARRSETGSEKKVAARQREEEQDPEGRDRRSSPDEGGREGEAAAKNGGAQDAIPPDIADPESATPGQGPGRSDQPDEASSCEEPDDASSSPEALARRIAALKPEALRRQTICAGLLFLLQPLLRDPRWRQSDQPPSHVLSALALRVLHRLGEPLEPALRDALVAREGLTLAVFAGLRDLEALAGMAELGRDSSEALTDVLLDDLIERIPEALSADRAAIALFYGTAALPDDLSAACQKLARLVLRRAELVATPTEAELRFSSDAVDLALRRLAWDADPGWVPPLGRVIRFHFGETAS